MSIANFINRGIGPSADNAIVYFLTGGFAVSGIETGTAITNAGASTDQIYHVNHCSISGFRLYPDEVVKSWDGVYSRAKSMDERHPQILVRSKIDRRRGSVSPEGTDTFISTDVDADDL